MTFSEELYKLADRAKLAEQKIQQAQQATSETVQTTKVDLEKAVNESRASAEARATKLHDSATASKDKLSKWWDEQQDAWNAHLAKIRHDRDTKKAEHDAKKADKRAEHALADAEFAIEFAYAAIEEAEYAALDAILAQAEAESVHSAV